MINLLLLSYIAVLALFVWLGFIHLNRFWKLSPVLVLGLLMVGLFIPMGWGPPWGPAMVARNAVQVIPSVAGEVVAVPVQANVPLQRGDILFRIDPTTYEAQVHAIEAQLRLAEQRLGQFTQLQRSDAGRAFDVQQREAERDQLRAQLDAARWDLDRTTVRAPGEGYVTNLALRPGARVGPQAAVMTFIDTTDTILAAEIPQIDVRHVEAGQPAEVTFKPLPGRVFAARVEAVIQAVSTGQTTTGGLAVRPGEVATAPFVVRLRLDDPAVAQRLPAGSTGMAAVFTNHVSASHTIRKVLLRQTAILNYVDPF
ncbi:efflux RND transporter periplasmic adaptor subunit [Alsobacter sp. KACC 23698]|uniref:Efflux RND transporter periplasmic adaptor subunit n=1 Tax=Alsobacter sp. KACC 23698 TaxID=3149229 RepID=A0AAU7JKG2_9HYPH